MTRTWREGEAWLEADGAPMGPSVTVTIHSSRPGHGPYRVTRDRTAGVWLHQPPCESWRHRGPGLCRHIREAVARAESTASMFLEDVDRLIRGSTWWAGPDTEAKRLVVAIIRLRDDGRRQLAANASAAGEAASLAGETPAEKVAAAEEMFSHPVRVTP